MGLEGAVGLVGLVGCVNRAGAGQELHTRRGGRTNQEERPPRERTLVYCLINQTIDQSAFTRRAFLLVGAPAAPGVQFLPSSGTVHATNQSDQPNRPFQPHEPDNRSYSVPLLVLTVSAGERVLRFAGWFGVAGLVYELATGRSLLSDLRALLEEIARMMVASGKTRTEAITSYCEANPDTCAEYTAALTANDPTYPSRGGSGG